MNALINTLLAAENEAKWLREEKLDAKLEDLQQRPEFVDIQQAVENTIAKIKEIRRLKTAQNNAHVSTGNAVNQLIACGVKLKTVAGFAETHPTSLNRYVFNPGT